MPRKYIRKPGVIPRQIDWTEEDLMNAFDEIKTGESSLWAVSKKYNIPPRTLIRRYEANNSKLQTQGKYPVLGFENEKRLVQHILKLGGAGFPPESALIRRLAFQFAENLKIKHSFNKEKEMAGSQWLQSFLDRNPSITIRQARAQGLNREEVQKFFNLFMSVLESNDLLDKPERIFIMDETEVQLNNMPGRVFAKKSREKGETITLAACCNAMGNYLPLVIIIKGVHKEGEFDMWLPPGSKVYMQKKSADMTPDIFYKWLTEHFIPSKPQGKVLLILDGHSSHYSAINMLETARNHDVILLCLPSHASPALQPLDKSVFEPFKRFYNEETNSSMRPNDREKLSWRESSDLLSKAWIRAATSINATNGFRGSGLYPVNSNALNNEFGISDNEHGQNPTPMQDGTNVVQCLPEEVISTRQFETPPCQSSNLLMVSEDSFVRVGIGDEAVEQCQLQPNIKIEAPSEYLQPASPEPSISINISQRTKQSTGILRNILEKGEKGANKNLTSTITRAQNSTAGRTRKRSLEKLGSNMENVSKRKKDGGIASTASHLTLKDFCVECFEKHNSAQSKADWIVCKTCGMSLHDACTPFKEFCVRCGKLHVLVST